MLGWPTNGQITIRSLARPAEGLGNAIQSVKMLGKSGSLKWTQTAEGLVVKFPSKKPCDYAFTLKIEGAQLKPVPIVEIVQPVTPDAKGNLKLGAEEAELHGDGIKQEDRGGQSNIGFWDRGDEWVSWKVQFPSAGKFKVSASCATPSNSSAFVLEAAGQKLNGKATQTADWDKFETAQLGEIEVAQPGEQLVSLRPLDAKSWSAMNLRFVRFDRVK